jgi:hypothetical protein
MKKLAAELANFEVTVRRVENELHIMVSPDPYTNRFLLLQQSQILELVELLNLEIVEK